MLRASLIWKNVVGTFIVFVIAFCLINPFQAQSGPFFWWAVIWGFIGAGLHLAANWVVRQRKRAAAQQPVVPGSQPQS